MITRGNLLRFFHVRMFIFCLFLLHWKHIKNVKWCVKQELLEKGLRDQRTRCQSCKFSHHHHHHPHQDSVDKGGASAASSVNMLPSCGSSLSSGPTEAELTRFTEDENNDILIINVIILIFSVLQRNFN